MADFSELSNEALIERKDALQLELERLRKYATLLDSQISLPGGVRVGLDSIIGLVPGIGDIATGSISLWIIAKARNLGLGRYTIFKMLINVIVDTVVGVIPFFGDVFDLVFKANLRNIRILEKYLEKEIELVTDIRK